ncbi:MAG: hypothetical protein WC342_04535 [Methanoregula sp.]
MIPLVAPENVLFDIVSQIPVLHDGVRLVTGPGASFVLPGILASTVSCGITRVRSAHRLYRFLKDAEFSSSRSALIIEHSPEIFDGASDMIPLVAENLDRLSEKMPVILYSPVPDRVFRALARAVANENIISRRSGAGFHKLSGYPGAFSGKSGIVPKGYYRGSADMPAI